MIILTVVLFDCESESSHHSRAKFGKREKIGKIEKNLKNTFFQKN